MNKEDILDSIKEGVHHPNFRNSLLFAMEKYGFIMIFDYIKAANFFPKYAASVKDWKKKMSGKNGRGNPVDFSEADKKKIKKGLQKLFKDLSK